ncbi:MAG: hypothetical protein EOP38_29985, partial [Rubrivivax sp.]
MQNPRDNAPHPPRQLLILGAAQAAGFFIGAMLGRGLGLLLGLDAFGPDGYNGSAMGGILLVGLGGGGGVHLARRWYR